MRIIKSIFKVFLLILIAGIAVKGGLVVFDGYTMYKNTLEEQSLESRVDEVRNQHDYTELSEISEYFLDGIVCIEDRKFYEHGAVDFTSLIRALFRDIRDGSYSEGGSTITQQTAKNLCFSSEKSIERKIAELFAARDLEDAYSKDIILELYVNIIYYGDGYTGIYQASSGYFGKLPSQLDLNEATLLAGLPQAPSAYALSTNYDKAKERREEVVEAMVSNNVLTEEEAEELT